MKTKVQFCLAVLLCCLARTATAGTAEFMREQLGVDPADYPFGSPASAFPGFERFRATVNSEERLKVEQPQPGPLAGSTRTTVQLSFVSNRLEAIEVGTGGKVHNDKLVAEFAKLLNKSAKQITGSRPYEHFDLAGRFSYRGLCSAEENVGALFRLTTDGSEQRGLQAHAAGQTGTPFFLLRNAVPTFRNDALESAWVIIERNSGPATNVSIKLPPGVAVQLTHNPLAGGTDFYNLFFRPDGTNFLPESWSFSLVATDREQKQREQKFEAIYDWKKKAPFNLQVTEAKE